MKRKMGVRVALFLMLTAFWTTSGCTRPNPAYCDDTRPCTNPDTPVCQAHACIEAADGATNSMGQMGPMEAGADGAMNAPGDAGLDALGADANPAGSVECIRSVTVGEDHACLLKDDGSIWCWGLNALGQLGDGADRTLYVPTRIGAGTDWKYISAGFRRTCGIKKDGTLWCWGDNRDGELQFGGPSGVPLPLQIGSDKDWTMVDAGGYRQVCGMRGSQVYCWGLINDYGELGLGNAQTSRLPAMVVNSALGSASFVAAGMQSTCAIASTGALWCWGRGAFGYVGDGMRENRLAPVMADTSQGQGGWIALGREHCGVRGTGGQGELLCWGRANPNEPELIIPTLFGTFDNWTFTDGYCGIRADKTMWCWGRSGKIAQVGTASDWTHSASSSTNTCAVRANRTLWCWGLGAQAMLGIVNPPQISLVPVQAAFSCQ